MAAAGQVLACSMQSNAPTKLRIFFGFSSLFHGFLSEKGRRVLFKIVNDGG